MGAWYEIYMAIFPWGVHSWEMKCSSASEPYVVFHSSPDCQRTNPAPHYTVNLAELEGGYPYNMVNLAPSADVYKDIEDDLDALRAEALALQAAAAPSSL